MKNEDVAKKHSVTDKEIGVVGYSARMDSSDESKVLVSLTLDDIAVVAENSGLLDESMADEYKLFASLSLFKPLFKSHFHPDQLVAGEGGVKVWVMIEVPKGFVKDEIILTCDNKDGMYFIRSGEDPGLSRYIPIIIGEDGNEITTA